MTKSTNLNLELYNKGVDPDQSFQQYRLDLDGDTDSNMTKIDDFFGGVTILLPFLNSSISGSFASYATTLLNTSGSITSASSTLESIATRFYKIANHSGSGQANFTNIPTTFTHLLLVGQASVNHTSASANIGIDFNGITTSGSYTTLSWGYSGSGGFGTYLERFDQTDVSQIIIGQAPTNITDGYLGTFFAIIPYYSGSASASGTYLYKTAMGFSVFSVLTSWQSVGIQGGVFLTGSSINRIRVFGSYSGSTRYNLHDFSDISLYGVY